MHIILIWQEQGQLIDPSCNEFNFSPTISLLLLEVLKLKLHMWHRCVFQQMSSFSTVISVKFM